MNLGMAGYNAATSANIPEQEGEGDVEGTILISGQVDQSVSDNKELRLDIELTDYRDVLVDEAPTDGDDEGDDDEEDEEIDLEGEVFLDLRIEGDIEEVDGTDGELRRVPGTTHITGTAESRYGVFDVDLPI